MPRPRGVADKNRRRAHTAAPMATPLSFDTALSTGMPVLRHGYAPEVPSPWVTLVDPVEHLTLPAETAENPFGALARFASDIPDGGAVACVIAYEAAAALDPSLAGLLPPSPDGLPLLHAVKAAALLPVAEDAGTPEEGPHALSVSRPGAAPFQAAVRATKDEIRAGAIFQANISRRLSARFVAHADLAAALFRRLVAPGPGGYAAFLPMPDGEAVLSTSPELFLAIEEGCVAAEPIKGTRPRGQTPAEDARLARALEESIKDRAENLMIADLLRNDLAKVCQDHSIHEVALAERRSLDRVHHLVSRIRGRLCEGIGPVHALAAAFPCGSVTGAPKHRAMQIIAHREGEGRGPYCGAIGLIRAGDRAIFSVPIRTGVLSRICPEEMRLDVRCGGGITLLSDPADEFAETEDKGYPFETMVGSGE